MFDYCYINSSSRACLHHVNCKVCTKTIFWLFIHEQQFYIQLLVQLKQSFKNISSNVRETRK